MLPSQETDTHLIEPMKIDYFRNVKCFKCCDFGQRAQNCPNIACQNRLHVNATDDRLTDTCDMVDERQNRGHTNDRKPPGEVAYPNKQCKQFGSQRKSVCQNRVTQGQVTPQVSDWVKRAECWKCHMICHLKRNCPNRVVPDRNRVPVFPKGNWNGPRPQEN